jgi:hypothetical protein
MATNYGSDTDCVTDIPLIDVQVTTPQKIIGQRIARRLMTPRGALGLIGDDADFGWDVRQLFNGKISPTFIATAESQIAAECVKDEQVGGADVDLNFTQSNSVMAIDINLTTAEGPFSLTLTVSQLTASLIFGGAS